MKIEWYKLLVSAFTDFVIVSGTAYIALPSDVMLGNRQIMVMLIGGFVAASRTIQQALKNTPESTAILRGATSVEATKSITVTENKNV